MSGFENRNPSLVLLPFPERSSPPAGFSSLGELRRATVAKVGLELEPFDLASDARPHFRILSPTGLALGYLVAAEPSDRAGWRWDRRASWSALAGRLTNWSAQAAGGRGDG